MTGHTRKAAPRARQPALVLCTLVLGALAAGGAAQANEPDLSGFWAVRFEGIPSGQPLLDELPEGTVLIDDAGGGELAEGDFAGLRLTERALAQVRAYDPRDELRRENACVPPSVVFYKQAPFPMEIHQGRDMIVFQMEYFDMYRIIFLDGREPPPADAPHTKSGFSVGRWEGDTLVVETTHIAPGTFMNNGFDHSENIRMTERFRLSPDGNALWLTQLYEDPEVFEGPAARYMAWNRRPGDYVYPYDCDPNWLE
jgi:hypothetical protein